MPRPRRGVNVGTMPGDVERLLAKFESGALLRPGTAAPSLVDLAQAVWRIAGVPGIEPTAAARELETRIGATDHLVVVIADGLGLGADGIACPPLRVPREDVQMHPRA